MKWYLFICALTIFFILNSMEEKRIPLSPTENTKFLNYLEESVHNGSYFQASEKPKIYSASKPLPPTMNLETKIKVKRSLKGRKEINITDLSFCYPGLNPIAQLTYTISGSRCSISLLEVLEDYQNQGLGTLLLQELKTELRKSDCKKITLLSILTAQNFYKKNGFELKANSSRMKKKINS